MDNSTSDLRAAESSLSTLLALALDEIDYGIVLVGKEMRVLHRNRAAIDQMTPGHPLQLQAGLLEVRGTSEAKLFRETLEDASRRGLRRLLNLRHDEGNVPVAVVPLTLDAALPYPVIAVMLGRRKPCPYLSTFGFAVLHGLSGMETDVLTRLAEGDPAASIATAHRVTVATVRTQINSIRSKTGSKSTRSLVRELAMLPPIANVLERSARAQAR